MIKLIRAKIRETIAGALKEFVADGYAEQLIKGYFLQQYGITSHPRAGADGLVLQIANGSFLIATGDKEYKVDVAEGEVCLHASPAVKIHLKADDSIEAQGAKLLLSLQGDLLANVGGNAQMDIAGEAKINATSIALAGATYSAALGELLKAYNDVHQHSNGNNGSPTGAPIVPMPEAVLSAKVKLGE